jgi:hypothetical protein
MIGVLFLFGMIELCLFVGSVLPGLLEVFSGV